MQPVDQEVLREQVKDMYNLVAIQPKGKYHFPVGRELALKLGYDPTDLDSIPAGAVESFAGVGYHFQYADLREGERVLDLGSGSGTDAFIAAVKVGTTGRVVGVDMTDKQLEKAKRFAEEGDFDSVTFVKSFIEDLSFEDASFDIVISNGVINLITAKEKVFQEITRVLKPAGRLAISDIVTEKPLNESITSDVDLWSSCIGGALPEEEYRQIIEKAGLEIQATEENIQYEFLSDSAQEASVDFGVKSISLLALKKK